MALLKKNTKKKTTTKKTAAKKTTKKAETKLKEDLIVAAVNEDLGGFAGHSFTQEDMPEVLGATEEEIVLGGTTLRGLDISAYQRGLNLQTVKNAGYSFVILRAGFTGWGGDGTNKNKDACFEGFYAEAKRVGLLVGAYWYSCASDAAKGKAEAQFMINNCLAGKQFELPIAMDVEDSHHQIPAGKAKLTDAIVAFCEELENNRYYATIYANPNFFNNYIDQGRVKAYDKWLALWNSGSKPSYLGGAFGLWQNGSSGQVDGYRVDTDFSYYDYASIMKQKGLNGFGGGQPAPAPQPAPQPAPAPAPSSDWPKYHTVRRGETLSQIAQRYYGNGDYNHYMVIARANNIANPNIINAGATLTIPKYGDASPSVIKVGDNVKIVSSYANTAYAKTANYSSAIGWNRVVMKIYNGANFPYAVGDGKGITGFCKSTGIKKI